MIDPHMLPFTTQPPCKANMEMIIDQAAMGVHRVFVCVCVCVCVCVQGCQCVLEGVWS